MVESKQASKAKTKRTPILSEDNPPDSDTEDVYSLWFYPTAIETTRRIVQPSSMTEKNE